MERTMQENQRFSFKVTKFWTFLCALLLCFNFHIAFYGRERIVFKLNFRNRDFNGFIVLSSSESNSYIKRLTCVCVSRWLCVCYGITQKQITIET